MRVLFSATAWGHYRYWLESDTAMLKKLNVLIEECRRAPFSGLGKPEPLRGEFRGLWSRRIDKEHRLIYRVTGAGSGQTLEIVACRYHYE